MSTAIATIHWKRQYTTRFTVPGSTALVLKPGENDVTEADVPALKRHEKRLKALEGAGALIIGEPRKPAVRQRPRAVAAPEPATPPVVTPAPPTHTEPPPPPPPPIDPDPSVDPDAPTVPGMPTMPEWSTGSSWDELKTAAAARGIEFAGNTSKAKLLELLEAWEDAKLIEGDELDADEDAGG